MDELRRLLLDAADGRFPDPDGGWRRVAPWRPGLEAVIAFTGHAVFALEPDVTDDGLDELGADGFGGAHAPGLISALAGAHGWIDSLDAVVAGRGRGGAPELTERPELAAHPRAGFAATLRANVRTYGPDDGPDGTVVTLGRGIAGLPELSFELDPAVRGQGAGATLVRAALTLVPAGDVVLAAVAPGNAASLRALLRAGFVPIGSVQLFGRQPDLRRT